MSIDRVTALELKIDSLANKIHDLEQRLSIREAISIPRGFAHTRGMHDRFGYLPKDGSEAMTGNLDLDGQNISRCGDVTPLTGKALGTVANPWGTSVIGALQVNIGLSLDTNDYIAYDKTNNRYLLYIGGVVVGYVDVAGFHNGAP